MESNTVATWRGLPPVDTCPLVGCLEALHLFNPACRSLTGDSSTVSIRSAWSLVRRLHVLPILIGSQMCGCQGWVAFTCGLSFHVSGGQRSASDADPITGFESQIMFSGSFCGSCLSLASHACGLAQHAFPNVNRDTSTRKTTI